MSPTLSALLLVVGGLVAGFVNTIAGTGSALSLPLLMLAGLDANVANGTNRLGVLAQTSAATLGFHARGVRPWRATAGALPASIAGAALGSFLATVIPADALQRLFGVVFLVLALLGFWKPNWLSPAHPAEAAADGIGPGGHAALFGVGFYGGLLQAGVGVPLLLALVHGLRLDLVRATAAKTALILVFTLVTLAVFGTQEQVDWTLGASLAVGSLLGGVLGSRVAFDRGAAFIQRVVQIALVAAAVHALWP